MEAIAKTKYLKGSPRKARLVIDLIRGQNVSRALSILKFTQKRAADPIAKCLNSAIANATYNAEQMNIAIDPDDLWVRACFVDMGPTKNRRRVRPAPQGRAYREQRHYCHITIEVTSDEKPKTEKELKAEAAKAKRIEAKKAEPKKTAKKDAPKAKKDEVTETAAPAEETLEAAPAVEETIETAPAAEETVEATTDEVVTAEASEEAAPAAEETETAEGTDEKGAEAETK
ncbi:MAG: 50S ribosomal protein L22 [Acidobacteria bacterium]|nr:50S ribosomal protein L22 [Acidobacteriota bacterium]